MMNTQLPFTFDPAEHARRGDPSTSHAAAEAAQSLAQVHVERILRSLEVGEGTAETIGDRCGLDNVAVCRRLAAMERQNMVARTGRKERQRNNRPAEVWEKINHIKATPAP